jgi:hypothetical protein
MEQPPGEVPGVEGRMGSSQRQRGAANAPPLLDIGGEWQGPPTEPVRQMIQVKNTAAEEDWAAWFMWRGERGGGVIETGIGRFIGPTIVEAAWNNDGGKLNARVRDTIGDLTVSDGIVTRIDWKDRTFDGAGRLQAPPGYNAYWRRRR